MIARFTIVLFTAVLVACPFSTLGATLHFGGGDADIVGSPALPTDLPDLTGTWDTSTKNWAVDTNGSSYTTWSNAGTNNEAYFGYGVTTASSTPATVTVTTNMVFNRLDVVGPSLSNKDLNFEAPAPVSFTLNGVDPTIYLSGGVNWSTIVPANISWFGTQGFTFQGYLGLNIAGDASGLTGTIDARGSSLAFGAGSKLGSTNILVSAGTLSLASANGDSNSAFSDDAVISLMGGSFKSRAYAGATASTETIKKLVLSRGYASIDVSDRAGGSGANGSYILADATAGIDRGTHDKAMICLVTQETGDEVRTDLVVQNGIAAGVLPWGMTSYGRLLELDAGNVLIARANTDAPADPNTWVADTDYRIVAGSFPSATLTSSLQLASLLAYYTSAATLTIDSGKTLTLTRGVLGLSRTGSTTSLTVTGGKLSTTADTLYVNTGRIASTINLTSEIYGTFDVALGGAGTVTIDGPDLNTYDGTTYTAVGGLYPRKPDGSAPAIPGDLVVLGGTVYFVSYLCADQQIAEAANVTIEEHGTMVGGGNAGTCNFGGIMTINGGAWLGGYALSYHTFDYAGVGLRFNGGRFGCAVASAGSYYMLTDVSYAGSSTTQATFENLGGSQNLALAHAAGNYVRTFDVADSTTLAAGTSEMVVDMILSDVTGTAAIRKTGSGVLELTAANTFEDGVTVEAGTLLVNNSTGSGTGPGAVVVTNTGTLGGSGIIEGAVTVHSGASVDAGASEGATGTLTITNNIELASGSTWHVDVDDGVSDVLTVYGDLTVAGDVSPSAVTGYDPPVNSSWTIASVLGGGTIDLTQATPDEDYQLQQVGNDVVLSNPARGTVVRVQ